MHEAFTPDSVLSGRAGIRSTRTQPGGTLSQENRIIRAFSPELPAHSVPEDDHRWLTKPQRLNARPAKTRNVLTTLEDTENMLIFCRILAEPVMASKIYESYKEELLQKIEGCSYR